MGKNKKGKGAASKGKVVGALSGIDLSGVDAVPRDERGMQNFDAMLAVAAKAPVVNAASSDPTKQKDDNRKSRKGDKPKRTIRFSIDTKEAGAGGGGRAPAAAASASRSPNRRSGGASRAEGTQGQGGRSHSYGALKIARKLVAARPGGPMSPSALSEASTAPPSASKPKKKKRHRDDDDEEVEVEAEAHVLGSGEEEEEVAEGENEEDENGMPPDDTTNYGAEEPDFPQPDEDDGPMDDSSPPQHDGGDEDDDDDDDLAPPPPPRPDTPPDAAAEEAADEEDPVDFPAGDDGYDDEHNDDGDKEGKGYRMADEDKDLETESEDASPNNRSNNRRRRLKQAAEDGSSSDDSGRKQKPSRSKKQQAKKKRKISRDGNDSDSDDSSDGRTKKSKAKKAKSKRAETDSDDDSPDRKMPAVKKKTRKVTKGKFGAAFSPKGVPLPRTYHTSPLPHNGNSPESDEKMGLRRSKRARIAPIAYWKGESIEYGPNDEFNSDLYDGTARTMPVPVGIRKSEPTPYKPRKAPPAASKKKPGRKKKSKAASSEEEATTPVPAREMEPFDTRRLRRRYKYMDGEETRVWNDTEEQIESLKVISYSENLHLRKLPVRAYREPHESNDSGLAAQSFNVMHDHSDYPSYLMGTLVLPPGGIKDPESVGRSAQTFTVVSCQPKSLEIAFSDPSEDEGSFDPDTSTRFFLSPETTFRIPPGNCYRLENHSEFTEARLTWTIIRLNTPESLIQDAASPSNHHGDGEAEYDDEEGDGGDGSAAAGRGRGDEDEDDS